MVETWGRGRPDYSKEIVGKYTIPVMTMHEAKKEATSKAFERVFSDISSYFAAVRTPLDSGEEVSLMDVSNGQVMPSTIPEGWYFESKAIEVMTDQPCRILIYFDGMLIAEHILNSHKYNVESLPVAFKSALLDPDATSSHTYEVKIKNLGDVPLYGKCIAEAEIYPKVVVL